MITTTNLTAGAVYGTRPCVESVAPMHAWKQQRPLAVGFNQIDNSTGVSARRRRHL
jgi:hypothetical protein